jgi:hypothetical protein
MVSKAQQEPQASKGLRVPMASKGLRVRRGLRDPRAIPVILGLRVLLGTEDLRDPRAIPVTLDLRVRRGLRDPRAIPATLDLRDLRDLRVRAARLMVRHARLLWALSGRWCRVSTPMVC